MKPTLIILLTLFQSFGYSQVRLNEMQSSNSTTLADNYGDFDDWIEIHNPTNDSIEIGGLVLKDQVDTWAIPQGDPSTFLPPHGYFLLWADDQEFQGIFHTNFKLASGGEFLGLYESDSITLIDSITIAALSPNQSYIRCESDWLISNLPSPLNQNECSAKLDEFETIDDIIKLEWTSDGFLVINIINDKFVKGHISLFSIEGKKLTECFLNQQTTILDFQKKNSGTYLVIVTTGNTTFSRRILISE
jgi:hypothetical protein